MLTIFILYSNDRKKETETTISCLSDSPEFENCQKILCSDGKSNFHPQNFTVLEVERPITGLYCWANMWDTAVEESENENILYIDSDRILPVNGLSTVIKSIKPNVFSFPKNLYSFKNKQETNKVKNVRDNFKHNIDLLFPDQRIWSSAWDAVRRKNPMSGCVAFSKTTFLKSGGLDKMYQGWGYPDTDYFEKITRIKMKVEPMNMTELHLHHTYSVNKRRLKLMNLWNGCLFCKKWGFKIHPRLHNLADELTIPIRIVIESNDLKQFLKADLI